MTPDLESRARLTPIRAILTHAARRGWCDVPNFEAPGASPPRTEWLTPAEVDALRAEADEWKRLCTIAEPGVAALRAELQRCEAACFDVQRDNIALRARVAELDADADALRGRVVRLWELVRSAYAEGWQDSRTDDQYDTATDAWDRSAACAALEGNPHE